MKLLRLLTAGRSMVGVKDSNGRYQMGDPRSMPKFESAKNPFRNKSVQSKPLQPEQADLLNDRRREAKLKAAKAGTSSRIAIHFKANASQEKLAVAVRKNPAVREVQTGSP